MDIAQHAQWMAAIHPPKSGDKYLTTAELAERLNVAPGTLSGWRVFGRGPQFIRMGKLVRYRESDVDLWLAAQDERGGRH